MDPSDIRSKATKFSLAQTALREASRLDKYLLSCLGAIFALIIFEFVFRILGWYILVLAAVPTIMFMYYSHKVDDLKGRANAYKNLRRQHRRRY